MYPCCLNIANDFPGGQSHLCLKYRMIVRKGLRWWRGNNLSPTTTSEMSSFLFWHHWRDWNVSGTQQPMTGWVNVSHMHLYTQEFPYNLPIRISGVEIPHNFHHLLEFLQLRLHGLLRQLSSAH